MAETIRGINVVIGAETTGLSKALSDVDKKSKDIQKELKQVEKLLKLDPTNTELLAQKQQLLADAVQQTQERLNRLRDAQQQVNEQFARGEISEGQYRAFQRELEGTELKLKNLQSQLGKTRIDFEKLGKSMQNIGQGMKNVGQSLTKAVTAPLLALGGLATKASVDFESAFAGVRKTVDATEEEFAVFRKGMRDMAKEIPAAATEIARVGEAAGQLGIQNDAILGFTRTMIDMGVATNMSSDDAAMALARLATITQMNQQDFDRLGATIVDLGNNLAATESEIVEMGLRLAGAGATVGMTEAQILAFAGSLAAVGINAEAGGTAFSKLMINIANSVAMGSDDLAGFAQVAGMTSEEFVKAFEKDAATAIVAFIEGLGKINETGGNTFKVIEDLGLSEIRLRDALLRASGAGDVMRKSLELGNKAWEENVALTNEAEERYKTTASQAQIFKNRLVDIGITLGDALVPALLKLLDSLQPLITRVAQAAEWFAGLDDSTRGVIIALGGLAIAAGPALMMLGSMVNSVGSMIITFGKISTAVTKGGGMLATFSKIASAAVTPIRALGTALVFLATNPIGLAISAIAGLVAGITALVKFLSRDSLPAIQSFGDQAAAATEKASGSFKNFRSGTESALQDTAKAAQTQGAAIGNNIADGVGKGTKKAKDAAKDNMKQMVDTYKQSVDDMKEIVDRNTETLNRMGDAIVNALKKQYDEAEKAQSDAIDSRIDAEKKASDAVIKQFDDELQAKQRSLDKQNDAEKKASDERLKIYDKEYQEKLKVIDEEAYQQIKALQDQIDAIDGQTDAEEKAAREQEHNAKVAELQKQIAAAETAEERAKIQADLTKLLADYERQQLLEQRKMQKDALKEQIDAVKETATAKKDALKDEIDAQKEAEKERLAALQESIKEEKEVLKERYDGLKEQEQERVKIFTEGLNEEKEAIKKHFEELKQAESLQAEARRMLIEQNNDEIVNLLETYNPKWQDAGQSFADSFKNGLNSEKQSIAEAVSQAVDIAPAIDKQVAELDRMQAKLKELEDAAKGSSTDTGGGGGGGGGISGLALDFDNAALSAEEFADVLEGQVGPAMRETTEAMSGLSEESLQAFVGLNDKATMELNQLYWSGVQITEDMAAELADTYAAMGQDILANLDSSHAEQRASLEKFLDGNKTLTDERKEEMLQDLISKQERERQEVEDGQTRIFEILSNALDDQRGLTKDEYEEINGIQRTFRDRAVEIYRDYETESKAILERLKNDSSELSAQQAAEIVKQSNRQKEEAIQAAEDQYNDIVRYAVQQRDETGQLSAEEADAIIAEAKRQRDESVAAAEDMQQKVVAEAKKQAKEHVDHVDWETGEIYSKWDMFKNKMGTAWNEMWKDAKRNVNNTVNDVKSGYQDMKTKVDEHLNGMRIAIEDKMTSISDGIKSVWDGIMDFFRNLDLKQIGSDIMQGLADGISNTISNVTNAAGMIGRGIKETFTGAFQIQSPSKVSEGWGKDIGRGLEIGLEKSVAGIKSRVDDLHNRAIPGIDTPLAGAGGSTVQHINFDGLFSGAVLTVRNDNDLRELGRELGLTVMKSKRGMGG
ncbi:phage tail tape measure protein [Paenibacillus senegalensis]|uniref:phage tail tape measure protein n=1 Tax=Paenibacillus senegalensis TaxID=1465766 RepID=UPI0002884A17|nr:phage tail tape measure protein [Paenibacillus senegalensis]